METKEEFENRLLFFLPNAFWEADEFGEIVIYTGKRFVRDSNRTEIEDMPGE